ncbi:hypothetical protein BJ912DRAFT_1113846 [Pholiota molesta]|nr:hypothetical protein BJ912DRAFT_1113846 [Pholiota molesta]
MVNDLLSIPQELQIQILSHLDAISLTHGAMTCKSMYKTLQTTSQLLYIVQLHLAGLKDASTSTAHSKLIEHLHRYRDAWLSPDTTESREYVAIDMKYQSRAYELVGGACAETDRHHLEIVSLPTSNNNASLTPRVVKPGMHIRDFAMDLTQDVIAYLEDDGDTNPTPPTAPRILLVHIRTLSTNAPHPSAPQSLLRISLPPSDRLGDFTHTVIMHFAHHKLALYFCTFDEVRPYIQIWDWTTSDVIDCTLPFDPLLSARMYEFGLLDSTSCFITNEVDSGSIRLYNLLRSPSNSATHAPVHLATLHLPPTADASIELRRISSDAGPLAANPLPGARFMLHPDDRLHVIMLLYADQAGGSVVLNLFVHQRVFMTYCRQGAADGAVPLEIPWEEWGPMHTRLIWPARIQRHRLRYIHGQRAVWIQPPPDTIDTHPERPPNTIQVLDFSLAAVSSADAVSLTSPSLKKGKRSTPVGPSTIPAGHRLFKHDVETRLPYVCTEWNLQKAYALYMIYEDGIIGVDVRVPLSSSAVPPATCLPNFFER